MESPGSVYDQKRRTDAGKWQVEVFFDGNCPLCRREVRWLQNLDRGHRILFTNISSGDFQADSIGIPHERLMAEIHGRLPDGSWITGVEVFRRLYSAIGLGWLVHATRLPGISHALEAGYRVFARNRLRWTGRCTGTSASSTCEEKRPIGAESNRFTRSGSVRIDLALRQRSPFSRGKRMGELLAVVSADDLDCDSMTVETFGQEVPCE